MLTCLGRDAAHVETGAAQRGVLLHTDSLQAQLGSLITKDGSFISLKEDKSIQYHTTGAKSWSRLKMDRLGDTSNSNTRYRTTVYMTKNYYLRRNERTALIAPT